MAAALQRGAQDRCNELQTFDQRLRPSSRQPAILEDERADDAASDQCGYCQHRRETTSAPGQPLLPGSSSGREIDHDLSARETLDDPVDRAAAVWCSGRPVFACCVGRCVRPTVPSSVNSMS